MTRVSHDIEIIPPDPRRHRAALADLIGKTFPGGYWQWIKKCRSYIDGSSYDWNASRIALLGGEMVGHVGIWRYQMRVGVARLTTAGIGTVATSGKYRKLGLGRRVFTAINQSMRQNGYDYSVLFGIPSYYNKFGYASIWPDHSIEFDIDNLPDAPAPTLRRKPGAISHLLAGKGELGKIYAREHAGLAGTAERGTQSIYTRDYRSWKLHELRDGQGATRGYFVTDIKDKRLQVLEVGGGDTHAKRLELFAHIRQLARRSQCGRVALLLVPEHPLMVLARRYTCRVTTDFQRNGGAMGQVVNLPQTLGKMTAELALRAAAHTASASFEGTLTIRMKTQSATLHLKRGEVLAVARPTRTGARIEGGDDIARLILGSDDPDAVLDAGDIRCTGQARQLARALFPRRSPFLCRLDGF